MNPLRNAITATAISMLTLTAYSQQPTPLAVEAKDTPPPSTLIAPLERWPGLYEGHKLDVVLVSEPGVRRKCVVKREDEEDLHCKAKHHEKDVVYQREDVAALIEPPQHGDRNGAIVLVAATGIALAGSFFVPLAASVVLRVLSFPLLLGAGWGTGYDHSGDLILYQKAGTSLSVKLRGH